MTGESAGVRFFCTAGRGMERFVADEVTRKVSAVEVSAGRRVLMLAREPLVGGLSCYGPCINELVVPC